MMKKVVIVFAVAAMIACRFISIVDADICNIKDGGLDACKPSVTSSNPQPPSNTCCSSISNADMGCICGYLNTIFPGIFGVNTGLAKKVPGQCGLPSPPCWSRCPCIISVSTNVTLIEAAAYSPFNAFSSKTCTRISNYTLYFRRAFKALLLHVILQQWFLLIFFKSFPSRSTTFAIFVIETPIS